MSSHSRRLPVLVSRCLLGVPCRYHGKPVPQPCHSRLRKLVESDRYEVIDVCPEVDGGLPVPRPPTRLRDGRLICDGRDVTAIFECGARQALLQAQIRGAKKAYLLKGSPSCDRERGVAGRLLAANGIQVVRV